jgi:hypothetical protein
VDPVPVELVLTGAARRAYLADRGSGA